MRQGISFQKSLGAAVLLAASSPLYALDITTNVGLLESYTNSTFITIINHLTPVEPVGTMFTDHFNFSTSGAGGSSVATELVLGNFLDITNLQVTLFNGTAPVVGTLVAGPVGSGVTLTAVLTANAPYTLQVTGTTAGQFGGSYSAAISAVPEAQTSVLMLAGLGLLGWTIARRKRELN